LPVAPQFAQDELGADAAGVGLSIASFAIASLLLRPIVGWSSDRFGRRPLLIGGSIVTVAALLLHVVANDLVLFIAARALLGAGEGFFFVAALSAGSDLAPPARRGEALSFLSLSLYLGIAIGPPIGEAVLQTGSFDTVWLAAAAVAAGAAALTWLVPETAPAVLAGGPRVRGPLIHPAGLFPGLIILLGLWGMAGYLTFLPVYAPEMGLRVVGRRWPDRFGAARLSGAALAVSAVGLAVLGLFASPVGVFVGTAVFAAGVAFTMPALLSLAVSRVPETERGTVVGTATVFLDLAFGVAPVVIGLIARSTGYGPTFLISAALAILASGLLVARRGALVESQPAIAR
jgi:MFS family permease